MANRKPVYRITLANGRFDHAVGKRNAVARAVEMTGAEPGTTLESLTRDWAVTIIRVSPAMARAVGL